MDNDLHELKRENQRLSYMAERDWLTGLYNRGATEEKINQILNEIQTGVMIVLDVDNFKTVNDRYGHLIGDGLLYSIARALRSIFFRNDILGRIGGDEFVVFIPVKQNLEFAQERGRQAAERLRVFEVKNCRLRITVTVGCSIYRQGDNYRKLFDRADQALLREKTGTHKSGRKDAGDVDRSIGMDMRSIQGELQEAGELRGAYFQSYETFKCICRFAERRLQRLDAVDCIILMTLTAMDNDFLPFEEDQKWMKALQKVITRQLRAGDVFSQYSSCQYLIMVLDTADSESEKIAGRIIKEFYRMEDAGSETILLYHCYPVRKANDL